MLTEPGVIRREHVEAFVADQVARWRPITASTRHPVPASKRVVDPRLWVSVVLVGLHLRIVDGLSRGGLP